MSSLYIHIPFCKRKCLYCDFYSTVVDDAVAGEYISALISQIAQLQQSFDTVYIGGGTPTALPAAELGRLLESLGKNIGPETEFTVEANPESLDDAKLKLMCRLGVNRLSVGVQSLDDRKLKKLGRIHDAAKAVDAVRRASKAGFNDISADLIFGVWGEEPASWERELEEATKLPITHISCYSLTYEKGTPLFAALKNKSITPLEDDIVAAMYETAIDRLALRGFKQYEISNFAKDGRRCRHNLSYWENNPYIGLGAAAVSYIDGVRSKNVADVSEYIARAREGRPLAESREKLSPIKRARETAAVKIRTRDGIDFAWFKEKTGYDFLELEGKAVDRLISQGLIKYLVNLRGQRTQPTPSTYAVNGAVDGVDAAVDRVKPVGICLKRKGFLHCDTVSSALL